MKKAEEKAVNENVEVKDDVARGNITEENVVMMIDEWDNFTQDEFAEKFKVKLSTVANTAASLRKESGGKACPVKRVKKVDMFKKVLESKGLLK